MENKHSHKFTPLGFKSFARYPGANNPQWEEYLILVCDCGTVKKERMGIDNGK